MSKKSAIFVVEKETNKKYNTMKKFDIIVEYNSLESELRTAVANYNAVTGENYEDKFNFCIFKKLGSHCMSWSKDELESHLSNRLSIIANCKRDTEVYQKTKEMKSTDEGIAFIKMLESKKESLENKLTDVCETFTTEFDNLLESVGLKDWTMKHPSRHIVPSHRGNYFTIIKKGDFYTNLSISIENRDDWKMTVNSSVRGSADIRDRSDQYQQFKAYITICDNCDVFQKWIETRYASLAHEAYDILVEIDKIDEDINHPYDAWMREKWMKEKENK